MVPAIIGGGILGIGVDIVDCRRLQGVIERLGQKALNRLFTPGEQNRCNRRHQRFQGYGKIYAAKEALVKAIGNVQGISWQDIEIAHLPNGRPTVLLSGKALINYQNLIPNSMIGKIDLSITDEPPYAQAFVIISAIPQ